MPVNKMDALNRLGPITDEMLAGLQADPQMKARIKAAARKNTPARKPMRTLVPAVCCAALAFACVGVYGAARVGEPAAAKIDTIAAGEGGVRITGEAQLADLGDGARVGASQATAASLFAAGQQDMPLVSVGGAVYRMLSEPGVLSDSLRGERVGEVASVAQEPSLASDEAMRAGLSNVAAQGAAVYAVKGLPAGTAVCAEVDGRMRVFQRVSYAGKGPGGQSLEDTFGVRGKVKAMELSGVGTLSGDAANAAAAVLLDHAQLKAADSSARKQYLTVTLQSGLKLQLGVSGDTVTGCGAWSCPEFFEAFESAL